MGIIFRHRESFSTILTKYFSFKNETKSLEPLIELLRSIRSEDFHEILEFLRDHPDVTENLGYYIHNLFAGKPLIYL